MKSKSFKSVISLILCFTLLCSAIVMGDVVKASTQSDLENELSSIDEKIKANERRLAEIASDKAKQDEYLSTLENQISETQSKMSNLQKQVDVVQRDIDDVQDSIDKLNSQISDITDSITETQNNIVTLENKITESYDTLAQRLRASYMSGEDSNLKILLGADSIASFLTRLEMMKRVSENDTKMIDDFKSNIDDLKVAQTDLENKKADLVTKREELNKQNTTLLAKKTELTSKQAEYESASADYEARYSKIQNYVEQLDKSSSTYKDYISSLENEYDKAEAELNSIIAAAQSATTTRGTTEGSTVASENNDGTQAVIASNVGTGDFMWPVGNISNYISSPFGYRTHPISGAYKFHGGIDITGPGIGGKPVYASKAGTVITTKYGSTGYGYYVIVDHGGGFVTVYAHLRAITCSVGNYVAKGQQIGKVGTTGASTGNHLHFEVRVNGTRVNPLNYVKKP